MDKSEAAEFLGVSVRTLERIAKSGRLSQGRAKRKTRPIVVFDKKELEKLKVELSKSKSPEVFRRLNTPKPKDVIGFRLDPFYVDVLAKRGKEVGLSPSEFARKLVVQALEDTRADMFKDEVRALREGLADTFFAFLTMHFRVSKKDAQKFVNDTILKEVNHA